MSVDDIKLNAVLVSKLYAHCLYDITQAKQLPLPTKNNGFKSLGYNEKNILILLSEPNAVHVEEEDLKLLTDILTACKLSLADICILNLQHNEDANYQTLNGHFNPAVIILFGIEPTDLGFPLQFPAFQLQAYNGQQYILSPTLYSLRQNKEQKKQLWEVLKKIF